MAYLLCGIAALLILAGSALIGYQIDKFAPHVWLVGGLGGAFAMVVALGPMLWGPQ